MQKNDLSCDARSLSSNFNMSCSSFSDKPLRFNIPPPPQFKEIAPSSFRNDNIWAPPAFKPQLNIPENFASIRLPSASLQPPSLGQFQLPKFPDLKLPDRLLCLPRPESGEQPFCLKPTANQASGESSGKSLLGTPLLPESSAPRRVENFRFKLPIRSPFVSEGYQQSPTSFTQPSEDLLKFHAQSPICQEKIQEERTKFWALASTDIFDFIGTRDRQQINDAHSEIMNKYMNYRDHAKMAVQHCAKEQYFEYLKKRPALTPAEDDLKTKLIKKYKADPDCQKLAKPLKKDFYLSCLAETPELALAKNIAKQTKNKKIMNDALKKASNSVAKAYNEYKIDAEALISQCARAKADLELYGNSSSSSSSDK